VTLFEADNVRIDVGGVPVLEQLTVKTTGSNVVVLGAPHALFEACGGLRPVMSGRLRMCGASPQRAIDEVLLALAPMDVPVPGRWTLDDLARESARLAGHPRRELAARARDALRALGLDAMSRTRLAGADLAVKRAAMIAAALATGAETLLVEDFTAGLADASARSLARLFVTATKGKRWMLLAGQLALSSPLGLHADEALIFASGRLVCSGPPAEMATRDRTFSLRTTGDIAAFAAHLREQGVSVETGDGSRALTVTLPEALSTLDLVRMAASQSIVVLELLPVAGALV
jgi:ABC-type multidrug transport system ATPase subunit